MGIHLVTSPLATRLQRYYKLDQSDLDLLDGVKHLSTEYEPGEYILERGATLQNLILLVSGWAVRTRYTAEGTRQIIHILLPGDVLTPNVFVVRQTDHSISTLTPAAVRLVKPHDMQAMFAKSPALGAAFWWMSEQEAGVMREQIVRLGRRSALERVPHLFLELHRRLYMVGHASEDVFILPLTQNDIGDTLGLSNVHVSRTLKKLEEGGYIRYQGSVIQIPDSRRLADLCDFDFDHLHLDSTIKDARSRGTL
ncbi:MAG: Crp/Fnr family transcriptional regulator [Gammaproteobacteria bacterium]|nr:Crp/Fnr family transcriptional regulator [Gammaproteobacteria bacterium]